MGKHRKDANTGVGRITNGQKSVIIKNFYEKHNMSPLLDQVNRMKIESLTQQILMRTEAVAVDNYVNSIIKQQILDTDRTILDYQADLIATQGKIASMEADIAFHKKVLADLQEEYLNCGDSSKKQELLEDIDKREDMIQKFERLNRQTIELRNKIRAQVDKKDYNEKAIKLKEAESKGEIIDLKSINYEALEIDD